MRFDEASFGTEADRVLRWRAIDSSAALFSMGGNAAEEPVTLGCRTSTANDKMGQDKLLELFDAQFRWNPLPRVIFRHFDRPKQSDFRLLHRNGRKPRLTAGFRQIQ